MGERKNVNWEQSAEWSGGRAQMEQGGMEKSGSISDRVDAIAEPGADGCGG